MSSKEAPRPGLIRAARDGKITHREGAAALGISLRQFRRLRRRYEAEGAAGLIHRSRGRPSPKRITAGLRLRVAKLMQGRYVGFNDCHLAEMLVEREGLALSRAMIQRLRTELGLRPKRRRRAPKHRRRRERASRCGALVLVDASEHRWCEDRAAAFALIGAVDDATGAILALEARPHEDLHGYALLLREMIRAHGVILRFHRAASIEDTRACLPSFIQDYNRRFTLTAQDPRHAWRPAPRDLDTHLACHYSRLVARDNTVALSDRWVQIPHGPNHRGYAGCQVAVTEQLDGRLLVRYQGRLIAQQSSPVSDFILRSHKGKRTTRPPRSRLASSPALPPTARLPKRPAPDHPWRRFHPKPAL